MGTRFLEAALDVPKKGQCHWIKEIFGFSDTEFAHTLGVSVETLRNWLKDDSDRQVKESARFQRLLTLAELAKGVVKPDRLAHWIHQENVALGDLVPADLVASAAGFRMVSSVLEDIRSGNPD